jgi:hypothetical protein
MAVSDGRGFVDLGGFIVHRNFQLLAVLLSVLLATPTFGLAQGSGIQVKVLSGEAGINNINQNVVVEPMVEVQDANGKPIPKATVTLRSPATGPSVTFFGASRVSTLTTDDQGRARAAGMMPNSEEGTFDIEVEASFNNMTANTTITQTNAVAPGDPTPKKKGIGWRLLAVIGAGAVAGVVAASRRSETSTTNPTSVGVTSVGVGTPR